MNCGHKDLMIENIYLIWTMSKNVRIAHTPQASFYEKVYLAVVSNQRMSDQDMFHS